MLELAGSRPPGNILRIKLVSVGTYVMVVMGLAPIALEEGATETLTEFSAAVELSETSGFSTVDGSGEAVPFCLSIKDSSSRR